MTAAPRPEGLPEHEGNACLPAVAVTLFWLVIIAAVVGVIVARRWLH